MSNSTDILKLKKQLLPTGRAFKVAENSNFEKLLLGLGESESDAFNDAIGQLNSIIPDNNSFTLADTLKWEETLGISSNELDSLTNRKAAILRKMQFPANVLGRQHKNYLEGQLKAANFNCKVYEYSDVKNNFASTVHKSTTTHSFTTIHGGWKIPAFTGTISNYIEPELEPEIIPTIENLRSIFWIAGNTFDEYFNIPPYRVEEFRHIVLTIKPLHTVALLRTINLDNWILATGNWDNLGYFYNTGIWTY